MSTPRQIDKEAFADALRRGDRPAVDGMLFDTAGMIAHALCRRSQHAYADDLQQELWIMLRRLCDGGKVKHDQSPWSYLWKCGFRWAVKARRVEVKAAGEQPTEEAPEEPADQPNLADIVSDRLQLAEIRKHPDGAAILDALSDGTVWSSAKVKHRPMVSRLIRRLDLKAGGLSHKKAVARVSQMFAEARASGGFPSDSPVATGPLTPCECDVCRTPAISLPRWAEDRITRRRIRLLDILATSEACLAVSHRALPLYHHPKNPRRYTQPQLLALLLARDRLAESTRGITRILTTTPEMQAEMGFAAGCRMPSRRTLEMFGARRAPPSVLASLQQEVTVSLSLVHITCPTKCPATNADGHPAPRCYPAPATALPIRNEWMPSGGDDGTRQGTRPSPAFTAAGNGARLAPPSSPATRSVSTAAKHQAETSTTSSPSARPQAGRDGSTPPTSSLSIESAIVHWKTHNAATSRRPHE